jgi:hypothetical protein
VSDPTGNGFPGWKHVTLHFLRVHMDAMYREIIDWAREMDRVRGLLQLARRTFAARSTLYRSFEMVPILLIKMVTQSHSHYNREMWKLDHLKKVLSQGPDSSLDFGKYTPIDSIDQVCVGRQMPSERSRRGCEFLEPRPHRSESRSRNRARTTHRELPEV